MSSGKRSPTIMTLTPSTRSVASMSVSTLAKASTATRVLPILHRRARTHDALPFSESGWLAREREAELIDTDRESYLVCIVERSPGRRLFDSERAALQ